MGRKVNGVYTVFFGKTLCILKHPGHHLRCLRPSPISPRKGYVGEGMTFEKLNGDTAERRLVTHRIPDCQAKLEMSSFLLKTSHHQDMISSIERRQNVDQLFYPKSVVVIGVSENPNNLSRNIVENLFEFQFNGEIFLVGQKEGILFGRRFCTSIEDLKEGIDVAVILTPAQTVPGILEACGKKKIRWAIVESGGFSEYSEEGAALEKEVHRIAKKWGIRMVGPNGIGIINIENGFVVPFVKLKGRVINKGKVSVLAQSGGVSLLYLNLLASANVGIAKVVSMGNKRDLNEVDYLNYLIQDPQTEIIGLYLESLERGRELMELARSTPKPMILHKANIGEGSHEIAKLHTSALANDDRVVDAATKQSDIIRTKDFRSFVSAVKILSLPAMKGNNLIALSRSGGIAIVAADSAERYGFRLLPPGKGAHGTYSQLLQGESHPAHQPSRPGRPLRF